MLPAAGLEAARCNVCDILGRLKAGAGGFAQHQHNMRVDCKRLVLAPEVFAKSFLI